MLKFVFMINMPGQNPDTFSAVYENDESYNLIVGSDNMDMAKDLAAKYAAEGFTLFNLCGDFDDAITAEIAAAAGEGVKVKHADYLPAELAKLEAAPSLENYGIIIVMRGVEEPTELKLECDDCKVKAVFVKNLEQSEAVAKDMAACGTDFIELCSWFDAEKTEAVSAAAGGKLPVGSCGL